jgi:two-component system sensor histidine kinase/response regulator
MSKHSEVIWDHHQALEYVGGDDELLEDLMNLFLKRKNILLKAVEDAIAAADAEAISDTAHALKGAVNHFAAKRAQKLAQIIEDNARVGKLEDVDTLFGEVQKAVEQLELELQRQLA